MVQDGGGLRECVWRRDEGEVLSEDEAEDDGEDEEEGEMGGAWREELEGRGTRE